MVSMETIGQWIDCTLGRHEPGEEQALINPLPRGADSLWIKGPDGRFVLVIACVRCKDEISRRSAQFITIADGCVLDSRVD